MTRGRPGRIKWTAEQDAMIRTHYPTWGAKRLAVKLGVDASALTNRANYLGVRFLKGFQWTPEALDLLTAKYATEGPAKLAKVLGTTSFAVTAKARRLGLESTRKRPPEGFVWTRDKIAAVKQRYIVEGPTKLAEEMGVTVNTIYRKASDLGLHTIAGHAVAGRKRAEESASCDIHYFDQWTPNMAYILGFLFADGSISKHHVSVSVCLAAKDRTVLEFMLKELKSTGRIYETAAVTHPKTGGLCQPQVRLLINSTVLVEQLERLGLHPRKTYNDDPFPDAPDSMLPHFIRGVFDGDGSACFYRDRGYAACAINFVGSPKFITTLRDLLVKHTGMRCAPIGIKHGKSGANYATVAWTAVDDLTAFHSYVYPPGNYFRLKRKKDILDKWMAAPHRGSRRPVRWAPEEEDRVRNLYHEVGPTKLAEMLNRDTATVLAKVKQLGLKAIHTRKEWTEADDAILHEQYPILGAKGLEPVLDRAWWNIRSRAKRLGLKFLGGKKPSDESPTSPNKGD